MKLKREIEDLKNKMVCMKSVNVARRDKRAPMSESFKIELGARYDSRSVHLSFKTIIMFLSISSAKLWYNSLLWNRGVRNINFAEIGSKVWSVKKYRKLENSYRNIWSINLKVCILLVYIKRYTLLKVCGPSLFWAKSIKKLIILPLFSIYYNGGKSQLRLEF